MPSVCESSDYQNRVLLPLPNLGGSESVGREGNGEIGPNEKKQD